MNPKEGMFKKSIQQGRSHFDEWSVPRVREHGTMTRTRLVVFFNIPLRAVGAIDKILNQQSSASPRGTF